MKNRRPGLIGSSAIAMATLLWALPLSAQNDDVATTKHNLSVSNGGTDPTSGNALEDYGEICVYCHTPHGGQVDAPLWNRNYSTATYQMYTSSTIDMTIDAQPTGISLACLSCHDGTVGLDVIINPPNAFVDAGGVVPPTTVGTNTMPTGGNTNLGTDLRNDHPISVTYDVSQDAAFNSKASVTTAGLKLFGDGVTDKVQCASCHNPHDNTTAKPFLRLSNSGSALCLTCHIK